MEHIAINNDIEYLALCKTYWNLKSTSWLNQFFKRSRIKALEKAIEKYDIIINNR